MNSPVRFAEKLGAEVCVGKSGFLFHRFEMAFEQLGGSDVPTDRQLARWVSLFETRAAWCASKGITYVTLVIPERHVIYADKLPDGIDISPNRPARRIMSALDPALRNAVHYPEDALWAARAQGHVFLLTDEHMNGFGSYICYRSLLNHIGRGLRPIPLESLTRTRRQFTGNLGMRLSGEPVEEAETLHLAGNGGASRVFLNAPGHARVEVFEHPNTAFPKAVVFGDSNVFSLWPFLVPHFARTVILHNSQRMFPDLVRAEQPTFLINIMSESRLGNLATANQTVVLPIDADIVDFEEHCGQPLSRARDSCLLSVDFAAGGNSTTLTHAGWAEPEASHTWMVDLQSFLQLPSNVAALLELDEQQGLAMEFDILPMISSVTPFQRLTISVGHDDDWLSVGELATAHPEKITLLLRRPPTQPGSVLFLRFEHPDAATPLTGDDIRQLSFAISKLSITRQRVALAKSESFV